mgnify:CR=1 FL=1
MKLELQQRLVMKYPKIFPNSEDYYGFNCGDGWYSLIDALCTELQYLTDKEGYPQVVAQQVTERQGALAFPYYVDIKDEKTSHLGALDSLIHFARYLSSSICETCGKHKTCEDCNERVN